MTMEGRGGYEQYAEFPGDLALTPELRKTHTIVFGDLQSTIPGRREKGIEGLGELIESARQNVSKNPEAKSGYFHESSPYISYLQEMYFNVLNEK